MNMSINITVLNRMEQDCKGRTNLLNGGIDFNPDSYFCNYRDFLIIVVIQVKIGHKQPAMLIFCELIKNLLTLKFDSSLK